MDSSSLQKVACFRCPILLLQAGALLESHGTSVYIVSQRDWVPVSVRDGSRGHGNRAFARAKGKQDKANPFS